jgi:hypothetical protein
VHEHTARACPSDAGRVAARHRRQGAVAHSPFRPALHRLQDPLSECHPLHSTFVCSPASSSLFRSSRVGARRTPCATRRRRAPPTSPHSPIPSVFGSASLSTFPRACTRHFSCKGMALWAKPPPSCAMAGHARCRGWSRSIFPRFPSSPFHNHLVLALLLLVFPRPVVARNDGGSA